ncbi:Ankyrin [Plasmopara halstedii]|uniref:Ankyrin n=1 Tax=Plasmopara halstedii TaxID=4781 RepID=A0A0P1AIG4_PLAHL|nr:Ankyrin [Plasmopara halstedii]CEG40984.1 Ankyrin [Plasmopara halstedii]|eukprot:XP_024577353.1 Ankyrin [Plasmopara halstedii]
MKYELKRREKRDASYQLTNLLQMESNQLNEKLLIASEKGNERGVFLLLHQGIDKDRCRGLFGYSPMHHAAARGHLNILQLLLDFGWNVDIRNDAMETPLHLASFNGHVHVAEFLLDRGAEINAQTKEKDTALFYSARKGKYRIVRLLLRRECDLRIRNCYGDVAEEEALDAKTLDEFVTGKQDVERALIAQSQRINMIQVDENVLPQKLREHIMSFLDLKSLGWASQVSHRWHRAADNPTLWKKLGVSRWGLLLNATMGTGIVPQMLLLGSTTRNLFRLNLSTTETRRPFSCNQFSTNTNRLPRAQGRICTQYQDQLRPQTANFTSDTWRRGILL